MDELIRGTLPSLTSRRAWPASRRRTSHLVVDRARSARSLVRSDGPFRVVDPSSRHRGANSRELLRPRRAPRRLQRAFPCMGRHPAPGMSAAPHRRLRRRRVGAAARRLRARADRRHVGHAQRPLSGRWHADRLQLCFRVGPLHAGQRCRGGMLGIFADILISTAAQYQRCFQARAAAAGHRERPRAPAAGDAASECAALKVDSEMAAQEPCDEILISRERTQSSIS